jgi:ubiquinone/menaquinone biosynthesis C-methylase UbiE
MRGVLYLLSGRDRRTADVESETKALVQRQFGANAAKYATSRSHAQGASLARLLEMASPSPDWLAVDVATGAGHTALAFAPHVAHVIATDLTAQMLHVARRLAGERSFGNMSFAIAQAEQLPFADETIDFVSCRIAPHHFVDVKQFVGEVRRVLRPGGVFGLVDNVSPDAQIIEGPEDALAVAAEEYNAFEKLRDPSHVRCLTLDEWLTVIASSGLGIRDVELQDKPMVFGPWADQMQASTEAKEQLTHMVFAGTPALQAFMRPEKRDGDFAFTLVEGLIVSERSR